MTYLNNKTTIGLIKLDSHQIDFGRWKDEDESDDEGGAEEGRLTINLLKVAIRDFNEEN